MFEIIVSQAAAVPRGIVCLLSALVFHEIGKQVPAEVWMAGASGQARAGGQAPADRPYERILDYPHVETLDAQR